MLNHIGTLATVPVTSPRIFMWVNIVFQTDMLIAMLVMMLMRMIVKQMMTNIVKQMMMMLIDFRYGNTADYAAMIKDLVRRFPTTKVV